MAPSTDSSSPNPSSSRSRLPLRLVMLASSLLLAILLYALPHSSETIVRASSHDSKAAGAALFHQSGCEHCHGVDGRGTDLGPDLSTIGKKWKKPQIERQIREGDASMPAFGGVLKPDEVKDLVDYLNTKRKLPKTQSTQTTPIQSQPAPSD